MPKGSRRRSLVCLATQNVTTPSPAGERTGPQGRGEAEALRPAARPMQRRLSANKKPGRRDYPSCAS